MIAHFGYKNGSGEYFIAIDTDKCNGCGDCVKACPARILEIHLEDPHDPFREIPVAAVNEAERKKIKYACDPCKTVSGRLPLPCMASCKNAAIIHSW